MGRYDFRAQRVLAHANLALETKRISHAPVWHDVLQTVPPPPRLARPVKNRTSNGKHKYKPQRIRYEEDSLRQEFFSDHPWELARPRVVLEDSGNDHKEYDWSSLEQDGKKIDGESVVQHQLHLKKYGIQDPSLLPSELSYIASTNPPNQPLHHQAAYDLARKQFYAYRHRQDIERRIAREEALHTGAYFGPGPNAIAEPLEDAQFDKWRQWAIERASTLKNQRMAGYSGSEGEEVDGEAKLSDVVVLEEEEEMAREDGEKATRAIGEEEEKMPETSQGAVADAVEKSTQKWW